MGAVLLTGKGRSGSDNAGFESSTAPNKFKTHSKPLFNAQTGMFILTAPAVFSVSAFAVSYAQGLFHSLFANSE